MGRCGLGAMCPLSAQSQHSPLCYNWRNVLHSDSGLAGAMFLYHARGVCWQTGLVTSTTKVEILRTGWWKAQPLANRHTYEHSIIHKIYKHHAWARSTIQALFLHSPTNKCGTYFTRLYTIGRRSQPLTPSLTDINHHMWPCLRKGGVPCKKLLAVPVDSTKPAL